MNAVGQVVGGGGLVDEAEDLEVESSPAWVMYQDLVVLATFLDTIVNKEF